MATASSSKAPGYIQDGVMIASAATAPDLSLYIDNTIRLLVLNQTASFTKRQNLANGVLQALGKSERITLTPIPEAQFSNADVIDYNQANCQVAAVRETDPIGEGTRTEIVRLGVGFPVSAKNKNPLFTARTANAMLEAFQEIIETYLLHSRKDFYFGWPYPVGIEQRNIKIVPNIDPNDLLGAQLNITGVKAYLEFSLKIFINS